jgi:hypothetical protein
VDERSFDNLVRDLAASAQSRRAVALAATGLVLSLVAPLAAETDAARRQARRKKNRNSGKGKKGGSGKGSAGGHGQDGGQQGDCRNADDCPRDPATGDPGSLCPNGECSCGGTCCNKGYACFIEDTTPGKEVCCYIDSDQVPPPEKEDLFVCPGERSIPDVCCERDLCNEDGTCSYLTLGRYRRNPR